MQKATVTVTLHLEAQNLLQQTLKFVLLKRSHYDVSVFNWCSLIRICLNEVNSTKSVVSAPYIGGCANKRQVQMEAGLTRA